MLQLPLGGGHPRLRRLLAIGAHSDDIEIGCGGTILSLTRSLPGLEVHWLVLSASGERAGEARASAEAFLASAGAVEIELHGFRDGFMPYRGAEVKEAFETLKERGNPDLILTHTRDDLHQDHRLACELTWNTFRNHTILEYEVPKVDGDLGRPNVYVPLTAAVAGKKVALLEEHFATQRGRHWFDRETFMGLMRIRGLEAVAPERYAEAFTCRKLALMP
jgi:LmbE family N-acetylglucosaminyl deacetylase